VRSFWHWVAKKEKIKTPHRVQKQVAKRSTLYGAALLLSSFFYILGGDLLEVGAGFCDPVSEGFEQRRVQ
jgi:membrane protein YqaA with SNARE-associated domain